MLKYIFSFIILIHGLIHTVGFARAFDYGNITLLTKDISKPAGLAWLVTAALFVGAVFLLLSKREGWPLLLLIAAVISQALIIAVWKDAKFGTIINIAAILVSIAGWATQHFESNFTSDVKCHLQRSQNSNPRVISLADIQHLPMPVQEYLKYSGVINKALVQNVKIIFNGEMRDKGKDWFKFQSVQYNFFDDPSRLFFMKAKMFGLTVPVYHDYQFERARMNVKLFGLISVVKVNGMEMDKTETVTVFNDMCLMVPASLIDKRIVWEAIDSTSAKATFTNGNNKISATLYFNETGQLINFISDDRYAVSDMKQYRFSTPVKDYKLINGRNVPGYGEAIWHYPEGKFVYGKFYLKSIEYNVDETPSFSSTHY